MTIVGVDRLFPQGWLKNRFHHSNKLLISIRLLENHLVFAVARKRFRPAGKDDGFNCRVIAGHSGNEFDAVHSRQFQIGDHQIRHPEKINSPQRLNRVVERLELLDESERSEVLIFIERKIAAEDKAT